MTNDPTPIDRAQLARDLDAAGYPVFAEYLGGNAVVIEQMCAELSRLLAAAKQSASERRRWRELALQHGHLVDAQDTDDELRAALSEQLAKRAPDQRGEVQRLTDLLADAQTKIESLAPDPDSTSRGDEEETSLDMALDAADARATCIVEQAKVIAAMAYSLSAKDAHEKGPSNG